MGTKSSAATVHNGGIGPEQTNGEGGVGKDAKPMSKQEPTLKLRKPGKDMGQRHKDFIACGGGKRLKRAVEKRPWKSLRRPGRCLNSFTGGLSKFKEGGRIVGGGRGEGGERGLADETKGNLNGIGGGTNPDRESGQIEGGKKGITKGAGDPKSFTKRDKVLIVRILTGPPGRRKTCIPAPRGLAQAQRKKRRGGRKNQKT